MSVKLLTEHHFEFLSLKGICTGSSESTLVKMPHGWNSHVAAHIYFLLAVLGPISPKDAGKTLAHEHLCCNAEALMVPDKVPFEKYCDAQLSIDMLWWLYQHP